MDAALLLPADRLAVPRPAPWEPTVQLATGDIGRFLYEPDGAVIRARGLPVLAAQLRAWLIDPHIAFLTGDEETDSPFVTVFEVLEVLPYNLKVLRRWLRTARDGEGEKSGRPAPLQEGGTGHHVPPTLMPASRASCGNCSGWA